MRKLRFHENVVGLIGACTELPNLAIVAEYFPLGSLDKAMQVPDFEMDLRRFVCTNSKREEKNANGEGKFFFLWREEKKRRERETERKKETRKAKLFPFWETSFFGNTSFF